MILSFNAAAYQITEDVFCHALFSLYLQIVVTPLAVAVEIVAAQMFQVNFIYPCFSSSIPIR